MASDVTAGGEHITDTAFGEVDAYLQSQLKRAEVAFGEAEDALAVAREALTAFRHDGTVPEQVIILMSVEADDAASDAAAEVLARRADRSVFDRAKANRDAVAIWLNCRRPTEDTRAVDEPIPETDAKLTRRLVLDHLNSCVSAAHTKAEKARARVVAVRVELADFRRNRQVSAETANHAWVTVAFAVADVGVSVLEGNADRAEFNQAKAVRTAVLEWIREQGFRVDTSPDFMAELPG